uniref:CLIP domain-containing serine protease n=1 Tax=Corethrella appendiculata TaxID=1370023 RepID=U5EUT0_9DIPT
MFLFKLILLILCSFNIFVISKALILPCDIPNEDESGICVKRENCPVYLKQVSSRDITNEKVAFLKSLLCNRNSELVHVCCPVNGDYRMPYIPINTTKIKRRNSTIEVKLASRFGSKEEDDKNFCGSQTFTSRIKGGDFAEIDEFPWMALLFYETIGSRRIEHGCGGALINHRFVLTAAHCVTGPDYESKGPLKFVRLGEYNIHTDPDCVLEEDDFLDCTDKPMDYVAERIIVHESYNPNSIDKHNDLALIKLNTSAQYTDFIRPICLPHMKFQPNLMVGNRLFVAGWGRTDYNFSRSVPDQLSLVKLKAKLPLVDLAKCSKVFRTHKLSITENQICAGGEANLDTCSGDSGSPLMYFDLQKIRWIVCGVVSLGYRQCGTEGIPGVYTNILQYVDWIERNSQY